MVRYATAITHPTLYRLTVTAEHNAPILIRKDLIYDREYRHDATKIACNDRDGIFG